MVIKGVGLQADSATKNNAGSMALSRYKIIPTPWGFLIQILTTGSELDDASIDKYGMESDVVYAAERGVGGKGWKGDSTWKDDIGEVRDGGTIDGLRDGRIPTKDEALELIGESGGTPNRIDPPHEDPNNPHKYWHINYITKTGKKGTIRIQAL